MLKRIAPVLMCILMIALFCAPALAADVRSSLDNVEKNDTIYLGYYGDSPEGKCIEWLVLDNENTSTNVPGMFLVTKDELYLTPLDNYIYGPSKLRDKCSTVFRNSFTLVEQSIILQTSVEESEQYDLFYPYRNVVDHSVDEEHLFPMSASEYQKYLSGSSYAGLGSQQAWYTRSECYKEQTRGLLVIDEAGSFGIVKNSYSEPRALRPAMNIGLSDRSVIFISPAEGGKESGVGLYPVVETEGDVDAWKLTLLNEGCDFFASVDILAYSDDRKLAASYSLSGMEESNRYICAIIEVDGVLYYGAVAKAESGSGTLEIQLPEDMPNGDYTIRLFAERRNCDRMTDYATASVDCGFTLMDRPVLPETGDNADPALWAGLMAASLSAMAALFIRGKREY